jgi:hypothetical protein
MAIKLPRDSSRHSDVAMFEKKVDGHADMWKAGCIDNSISTYTAASSKTPPASCYRLADAQLLFL